MVQSLASYIEHTLLKPESTADEIDQLCREAREQDFVGVCVNGAWLPRVVGNLQGCSVRPVCVVGFPLGSMSSECKAFEARWCVDQGAQELDTVLALGALKSGLWEWVESDVRQVVEAAGRIPVKVIFETHLLSREEIIRACQISHRAGAKFVKTSTGFSGGGARVEDVALMKDSIPSSMGVKASGGIRSTQQAWELIRAGAQRLGTSSGVRLMQQATEISGY